jgi:hypothetical protein
VTQQVRYEGDLAIGHQLWRCLACWGQFEIKVDGPSTGLTIDEEVAMRLHDCDFERTETGVRRRRP